jgi:competence protein ComEC
MVIMAAGFVWLALLVGPARWAGLPVLAIGAAMALRPEPMPDLLVARAGENVAQRNADGLLVPALLRRARFSVEKWLAASGEEATPAQAARRGGWNCTGTQCRAVVKGRKVLFVSSRDGRLPDCKGIDILITDFPLRGACASLPTRIDRFDLWRNGAHALYLDQNGIRIETARQAQGNRPWVVKPEARSRVFTPASRQDDRALD